MSSAAKIVCILGPTGAGKTAVSLGLAERFSAQVVNFDSRQVYRDFPIITAQPDERDKAVCPHHLYGMLETTEAVSAASFVDMAKNVIEKVKPELPLLVGGTGLYLQALTSGLAPIPDIPEEVRDNIRRRLETEGSPALFKELESIDPEYAAKTHPNNRQRNARALEVFEATGKTFSWWHNRVQPPSPYDSLKVGIAVDLDELTPLLAKRIDMMIEAGAIEEVRKAWEKCSDPDAPGWTGIGCSEVLSYFKGDLSLEETKKLWMANTRAYAKRQITWFKRDSEINWFSPGSLNEVSDLVENWLA
jgi:tRNA dimethylallyltransferase